MSTALADLGAGRAPVRHECSTNLLSCTCTGDQLDAAFATLRLLNRRVAALSSMPHSTSSCSSAQGVNINAQVRCYCSSSWLAVLQC